MKTISGEASSTKDSTPIFKPIPAGPQTKSPVHADLGEITSVSYWTAPLNMGEFFVIENNLIITD